MATSWIELRDFFMVTRISTTSKECVEDGSQIARAEERKLDDLYITRDSQFNSNEVDKECGC